MWCPGHVLLSICCTGILSETVFQCVSSHFRVFLEAKVVQGGRPWCNRGRRMAQGASRFRLWRSWSMCPPHKRQSFLSLWDTKGICIFALVPRLEKKPGNLTYSDRKACQQDPAKSHSLLQEDVQNGKRSQVWPERNPLFTWSVNGLLVGTLRANGPAESNSSWPDVEDSLWDVWQALLYNSGSVSGRRSFKRRKASRPLKLPSESLADKKPLLLEVFEIDYAHQKIDSKFQDRPLPSAKSKGKDIFFESVPKCLPNSSFSLRQGVCCPELSFHWSELPPSAVTRCKHWGVNDCGHSRLRKLFGELTAKATWSCPWWKRCFWCLLIPEVPELFDGCRNRQFTT